MEARTMSTYPQGKRAPASHMRDQHGLKNPRHERSTLFVLRGWARLDAITLHGSADLPCQLQPATTSLLPHRVRTLSVPVSACVVQLVHCSHPAHFFLRKLRDQRQPMSTRRLCQKSPRLGTLPFGLVSPLFCARALCHAVPAVEGLRLLLACEEPLGSYSIRSV